MKKQITRFLSILLAITIVYSCSLAFAASDIGKKDPSDDITVRWTNTDAIAAGLSINNRGKATCGFDVELTNSTDTGTVYMYLQRLKDGTWTSIKSWSASGSDNFYGSEYYYVTSGYSYRVHIALYVYNSSGNFVEYAQQDSPVKYY